MTVKLKDHKRDNSKPFESRAEAEEKKQELVNSNLGYDDDDLEIVMDASNSRPETDGGPTVVEETETAQEPAQTPEPAPEPKPEPEQSTDALDQLGEELDTDPLSILPGHMVDEIQGQPAVNKRGYAMIAERYDIETSAEIVEFPWENDENRCVAHATAITSDGKEYSGWATASKEDGDMPEQLIELAETRSLKRSISWASGVGIVSYQELTDQL